MNGLSCGEESMTICSAVLIGCQRVTDGRMDVKPIAITCFSIADARKNEKIKVTLCENAAGALYIVIMNVYSRYSSVISNMFASC